MISWEIVSLLEQGNFWSLEYKRRKRGRWKISMRDSTLINRGKENSKKYLLLEKCLLFKGRMTQIPLRVFGQNDFPLRRGGGSTPQFR